MSIFDIQKLTVMLAALRQALIEVSRARRIRNLRLSCYHLFVICEEDLALWAKQELTIIVVFEFLHPKTCFSQNIIGHTISLIYELLSFFLDFI